MALLAKLRLIFHHQKDELWAHVLAKKYKMNFISARSCSVPWSGINKGDEVFPKGTRWQAGSNSNLRFWYDHWCSQCILRKLIASPLPLEIENLKMKDVFYNGVWHLDGLSFDISPQVAGLIKSYPMRSVSSGEDVVIWISSHNGDFNPKNAYQIANSGIANHSPLSVENGSSLLILFQKSECFFGNA